MNRAIPLLLSVLALLLACDRVAPPVAGAAAVRQPIGEPDPLGFPNAEEREMFVLTNQARHAPSNQCGDWTEEQGTEPRTPLGWAALGAQGARYTAEHLHDGRCFQHESCCTLERAPDGSVGCVGGWSAGCGEQCGGECAGGTDTGARYALFDFTSWSGENLAAGNATAAETICQWLNSDGHRRNIYSGHTTLGVGYFQGPECYAHYWVHGFGSGEAGLTRIPGASAIRISPRPAAATDLYFAANYWDPDTRAAPLRATVVVDGHCLDLSLAWGAEWNGTYEYRPPDRDAIPPGCHRYQLLFVDGDANRVTYPDEGTLGVSIGGAACPDWDAAPAPSADCEGGPPLCEEGEEQPCYGGLPGTEGVGACHGGYRACRNGFWSQCRGERSPRAEVCNGVDDDCDGSTDDEVAGLAQSCTMRSTEAAGACAEGETICVAGRLLCGQTVAPVAETCDATDEDCDGAIDDGFGQLECGLGTCRVVLDACNFGVTQSCTPLAAGEEVCTPAGELARDEDCDGVYDEGCACTEGAFLNCYSGASEELDSVGCRVGRARCEGGAWAACVGEERPHPEICNDEDDDCDGDVDEAADLGHQRCGVGACGNETPVCVRGVPAACEPRPPVDERCNGVDDDCDGTIDPGCLCNDGAEQPCWDGPPTALGTGTCVGGVQVCNGGRYGGCERQVLPVVEQCADGLDQDCDGAIDEADCEGAGGSGGSGGAGGAGGAGGSGGSSAASDDDGAGDEGGCGCVAGGSPGDACVWALLLGFVVARRRRS